MKARLVMTALALCAACVRHAGPEVPRTKALPDSDEDGIADAVDVCVGTREDARGAAPKDGCPLDDDGDGVLGAADRCASARESRNGWEDGDGCPDEAPKATAAVAPPRARVRVTETLIEIDEKVQFTTGSAIIDPVSYALLDEVASTLKTHADIDFVEIAGHADERGGDGQNLPLTRSRASAVLEALAARGVDRRRLRALGYSAYCPLEQGRSEAAYARNRRVEFRILRRAGADLAQRWGGCDGAELRGMKPLAIPADAPKSAPEPAAAEPAAQPEVAASVDATAAQRAACEGVGKADACWQLGVLLEGAAGVAPDANGAAAAFGRACKAGLLHACTRLGAHHELAGKHTEAAAQYTHACKGGEGSACDRLAVLVEHGKGTEQSDEKAVALYRNACEGGDAPGCAGWGALVYAGRGTDKDRSFGVALIDKACAQHWAPACADAKRLRAEMEAALKVTVDAKVKVDAKAEVEVEKPEPPACAMGDAPACRTACDLGVAAACTTLGTMLAYGVGGQEQDAAAAFELFGKAAAAGHARAHVLLGLMLEGHAGVKADGAGARKSFRAACDADDLAGCTHLARLQLDAGQVEEAHALLDKACDGGEGSACLAYGRLHASGKTVAKDSDRALELYARGCSLGSAPACSAHGVLTVETSVDASVRADGIAEVRTACKAHYAPACSALKRLSKCELGGLDDCRARCKSGEHGVCALLGDYYAEGRWVAQSDADALLWYRAAYKAECK